MLERLLKARSALEQTVIADPWKEWLENNTAEVIHKAEKVHEIVHRQSWWRHMTDLLDLMR